ALTAVNAQERANTIPRLHKAKTVACGFVKWGKRACIIVVHSVTRGWQDILFLLGCMGYMATHTTSDGRRVLPLCIEGRNSIGSKTYPRKGARPGRPGAPRRPAVRPGGRRVLRCLGLQTPPGVPCRAR